MANGLAHDVSYSMREVKGRITPAEVRLLPSNQHVGKELPYAQLTVRETLKFN